MIDYFSTEFVKNLKEIFVNFITSFDEIKCYGYAKNSSSLSDFCKSVNIYIENYENLD